VNDDRTAASAVLPYSYIVGQPKLKQALELAFIAPAIRGVLISGQRGTAKSTAVRAFSRMVHGDLPVTLPINATDDRVVGGWRLDMLMQGEAEYQPGLLEEASDKGMLYIDEVNLLEDHIVNLILDAAATNLLTVQRDMIARDPVPVYFSLVGTMNPEEGSLRPQLLDRFGLLVPVTPERDNDRRRQILETVIRFDEARQNPDDPWLIEGRQRDDERRAALIAAKERLYDVDVAPVAELCAAVAEAFDVAGHRADYVMALAARGHAALRGVDATDAADVREVAAMALAHRRAVSSTGEVTSWTEKEDEQLGAVLSGG
jgi:magnesium chelatase subunit I